VSALFSSKEDTRTGLSSFFDPSVVARISSLELRARHVVEGVMSGIHRSRARGFSVEFEEHRAYSPGDELRHIDWKAFGKFDRYLVKQYEDETNLRAHLVVDASGSMDYGEGSMTKWSYAATLSASLAHLLLRQSDAVGLMLSRESDERLLPAKAVVGVSVPPDATYYKWGVNNLSSSCERKIRRILAICLM